MGWAFWGSEYGHDEAFTDQRCTLIKDANVEGLPKGPCEDLIEGLKRGFYSHVEEAKCPNCQQDGQTVYYEDGKFYCIDCEEVED